MTEFWTLIGFTICDEHFREELKGVREDLIKLGETIQKHGFRLSSYELVEFQRVISIELTGFPPDPPPEDVLDLMDYLHNLWWVPEDPCLWDFWTAALNPKLANLDPKQVAEQVARDPKLARHPKYLHPYLVFDNKTGKNVLGAVDPLTGEPESNELFVEETRATQPEDGRKRFEKAKIPQK